MLKNSELIKRKIGNHKMYVDKNDPGISMTLRRPKYLRKWQPIIHQKNE